MPHPLKLVPTQTRHISGNIPAAWGFHVMATAPEVNPLTFIAAGDEVVVLGRIVGKTRKTAAPIDVTFAHVWTVREGYLRRLRAFTDTAKLVEALSEG